MYILYSSLCQRWDSVCGFEFVCLKRVVCECVTNCTFFAFARTYDWQISIAIAGAIADIESKTHCHWRRITRGISRHELSHSQLQRQCKSTHTKQNGWRHDVRESLRTFLYVVCGYVGVFCQIVYLHSGVNLSHAIAKSIQETQGTFKNRFSNIFIDGPTVSICYRIYTRLICQWHHLVVEWKQETNK